MKEIPLILTCVTLNAFAQIFLKKGVTVIGQIDFSVAQFVPSAFKLAVNPFIALGMGFYVASIGLWLLALSRVEVSFAYPFLSVGYIITAIIAYLILNETLSLYRVSGILIICLGVILISKS